MPRIPYKKIVELARVHMNVSEFSGFVAALDQYVDEQPLYPRIAGIVNMAPADVEEELSRLRQANAAQAATIVLNNAAIRRQAGTIVDLQHKLNTKGAAQ